MASEYACPRMRLLALSESACQRSRALAGLECESGIRSPQIRKRNGMMFARDDEMSQHAIRRREHCTGCPGVAAIAAGADVLTGWRDPDTAEAPEEIPAPRPVAAPRKCVRGHELLGPRKQGAPCERCKRERRRDHSALFGHAWVDRGLGDGRCGTCSREAGKKWHEQAKRAEVRG